MSARESRTLLQSLRTFIDPKTIPFLVAQGVPRKLLPVGTLLLGMILAFLWAYWISPNVNTAAEAVHLGPTWKDEWVKQVAWQYAASRDQGNAQRQLEMLGDAATVIAKLLEKERLANPTNDIIPKLEDIQKFATDNPEQLKKVTPSLFNGNFTPVLCIIGLAIILGGAVIFNTIIPVSMLLAPKVKSEGTSTLGLVHTQAQEAKRKAEELAKAPPPQEAIDRGTPVGRYMSTYIMGDDLYDDSFSIETASGEFLGETGAGISKTIGVGDPKKVTAVEVWVFDKNDIRTLTKVLMSEHAYNDEAIRAELAPKGEAVSISANQIVMLETQTLTVQARIIDLAYGSGALPPESFFERLSVEISAWPKKGTSAPPVPPAFGETGPM